MGSITSSFVLLLFILIMALLQLCCSQKAYPNVSCVAGERSALLQFRSSLVDRSNRLSSWSGEDCCNWEGVGCNKSTGRVVKLDLHNPIPFNFNNSLTGEINPSLLSLEHLGYLDLSWNNFSGIQIPKFFGLLRNLRYLNLSRTSFVGDIPHDLENLSYLHHLDLSYSYYYYQTNGLVSKSISWVSKLSSLESLNLVSVNLSGAQHWFQAINMLPSLKSLTLRRCELISLPKVLHVNLTSLILLDLSENDFNSTIPLWFYNMSSLEHLDLSVNNFYGPIPPIISQLNSLTSLRLSDNNFAGSLPLGLLCNLTSLRELSLGSNKFEGAIPREIGCFRHLELLELADNKLNGNITSNLWQLRNLEFLDISQNALTGEILEVHFAELQKLKHLYLSSNSLTLSVRSPWVPPFQLQSLVMDSIKIGPRFPSWLQTQKNLEMLSMHNASISGNIPAWFETVHSRIQHLDLSFNNITGKVPNFEKSTLSSESYNIRGIILSFNKFEVLPTPYQFPSDIFALDISNNALSGPIRLPEDLRKSFLSVNGLYLNDNRLNGSIPESICGLTTLHLLDLSNNQLSGRLPLCLGNLRDLLALNLGNNSLSGQIPSSLGSIEVLQSLHLNNNKFNGELPVSFQNLRFMQFLDLGQNELKGIIPSWIGEYLSEMRILSLQSNKFHGDVPLHLCRLSNLQVLNLAQNNLTGRIPYCFNNFSAMGSKFFELRSFGYKEIHSQTFYFRSEKLVSFKSGRELEFSTNLEFLTSLDLSQNHMVGEIPDELTDLVGLLNLKLSRNHFNGSIPEKIGNLKQLQSLDLSMNELSGSIPPSLANLNFLNYLNLSSNKLSGPIPAGNQLQTLIEPSIYANNSGLCGKPLSNNCEKSLPGTGLSKDGKDSSFSWFLAGVGPGFGAGFLGIFCLFLFKKSWRQAYFKLVENLLDSAWGWIAIKTSKLRRKE